MADEIKFLMSYVDCHIMSDLLCAYNNISYMFIHRALSMGQDRGYNKTGLHTPQGAKSQLTSPHAQNIIGDLATTDTDRIRIMQWRNYTLTKL